MQSPSFAEIPPLTSTAQNSGVVAESLELVTHALTICRSTLQSRRSIYAGKLQIVCKTCTGRGCTA